MGFDSIKNKIENITDGGRNTAAEMRSVLTEMTQTLSAATAFSGTTDGLAEGSTNLYYTNDRVNALISGFTSESVTGSTFDSGTGDLILTTNSGTTITTNVDGRYSLTNHTHNLSELNNDAGFITGATNTADFNTHTGDTSIHYTKNSINLNELGSTGHTHDFSEITNTGHTHTVSEIIDFTDNSANWDSAYNGSITGTTFDTNTGDLELRTLSGSTITENLDGRYSLTGHTHSLDDVTSVGNTTTNSIDVSGITTPYIQFPILTASTETAEGEIRWNGDDGTMNIGLKGGNVVLQTGQEIVVYARADEDLVDGDVVYSSGAVGISGRITVSKFIADGTVLDIKLLGIVTEPILSGDFGFITTFGSVRGVKTDYTGTGVWGTTWVQGDILYVSDTVSGGITNVAPTSPNHNIRIGILLAVNANNGVVFSMPTIGSHLEQLHDVFISGATDGDVIQWNNSTQVWENQQISITESQISDLQDYSLTGHTHTISEITDFTDNSVNWNASYNDAITGMTVTGAGTKTITLEQRGGSTIIANFTDLQGTGGGGTGEGITGATFNTSDGNLILTTNSGSTIIASLEGRYALDSEFTSHTGDTSIHYTKGSINLSELNATGHTHTISEISDFPTNISSFTNDIGYLTGSTGIEGVNSIGTEIGFDTVVTIGITGGTTFIVSEVDGNIRANADFISDAEVNAARFLVSDGGGYNFVNSGDAFQTALINSEVTTNRALTLPDETDTLATQGYVNLHANDTTIHFTKGSINLSELNLTGHTHTVSDITDFPTNISTFTNDVGYITGATSTADDYITSGGFDIGTGDLTLTRLSGGTVVTNLDNRYSLTGHTHDFSEITNTGHTHTISEITDFPTNISTFTNDIGYITGFTDTNDNIFVSGASFNTGTGNVLFTNTSGGTFNTNLDGRYLTSLPLATATVSGVTKLFSNTVQSVAATAVSTTASRTYGTQFNSSGQVVVNVPWTNTTYTVISDVNLANTTSTTGGLITGQRINTWANSRGLTTGNTLNWTSAYNDTITGMTVTGTVVKTINLFQRDGGLVQANFTDSTGGGGTGETITGSTFNIGTGDLTLTTNSGSTITANLDGRYSLTGHTHSEYALSNDLNSHTGDTSIHYTKNSINLSELGSTGHTHSEYGDVFKVGTPLNNQIAVWTGNGTLDGSNGLTWDNTVLALESNATNTPLLITANNISTSPAFKINLPTSGEQKGFQIAGIGETFAWASFERFSNKPGFILGDGTLSRDTNLYRDAADVLKTDDAFFAVGNISGGTFIKTGGVSTEFLKADGSVDSNSYLLDSIFNTHTGDTSTHFTVGSINLSDLATTGHTHDFSEITNTGHTHTVSEITDFPTDLTGFTDINSVYLKADGSVDADSINVIGTTVTNSLSATTTASTPEINLGDSYIYQRIGNRITLRPDVNDTDNFFEIYNDAGNTTIELQATNNTLFSGFESGIGFNTSGFGTVTDTITFSPDDTLSLTLNPVGNTATFVGPVTAANFTVASGGTSSDWNTAYDDTITGMTVTGTTTKTINLFQRDGGLVQANFTDSTGGGGTGESVTGSTFSATTGDLTLTTNSGTTITSNLDNRYARIDGSDTFTGDLAVSTNGSSDGSPRIIGYTELSTGEAMAFDFGDAFNSIVSGFNKGVGLYSYNPLYFYGGRNALSRLNIGVNIPQDTDRSTIFVNTVSSKAAVVIRGAASQNGNLLQIEDSNSNTLSGIDSTGRFFGDGSLLSNITNTTGATFNTGTGDLEFTNTTGGTFNVDLDGRYSLTGHTHDFSEITNTGHTHTVSEITDLTTATYKLIESNFDFTSIPGGYDNAVWVIKDVIDLSGGTATLPLNVTLDFQGGKLLNGTVVFNNSTLSYSQESEILSGVTLSGTVTNDSLDVRLFGMYPNEPTIDSTLIIDNYLINLDVELFFPKGNYYFSELHITKDNFKVRGVTGTDIAQRTTFHPFTLSQYYIIKLGGGKFTLNQDNISAPHIEYPIIEDVHFTTPIGYSALTLSSATDITGVTYVNAALVIDKVQVGKFAVNGNTIHNTPFITIGYSYELYFDYITMYGNHGKSDLPIIQFANNLVSGQFVSATIINKLQVEVFVGPVIKTSIFTGINELTIGDVFIEGTIEWEAESITGETRYTEFTKSLPAYYSTVNLVPIFDFNGAISLAINTMHINGTSTEWQNSLDPVPTDLITRSLFKLGLQESEIQINNLLNGAFSKDFYIHGTASEAYRNNITIAQVNPDIAFYNEATGSLNLTTGTHNKTAVKLKDGFEYSNDSLSKLLFPFFIESIGNDNTLTTIDEDAYTKVISTRWDNYILSEKGFYVDSDILTLVGKISTTNTAINVEYYDNTDSLLTTQSATTSVTPSTIFTNTIVLDKPNNYSYLKLVNVNVGFLLYTYSISASNAPNWNTAYDDSITGMTVTGTTTKTITLNQKDGSVIQANFTDISGGGGGGDSITGATFDTGSGDLDLNSTGSTVTVNLDGRYSLTGHTHSEYVSTVGTPVNNQIGIWTGDGTLEGDGDLTWDTNQMRISTSTNASSLLMTSLNIINEPVFKVFHPDNTKAFQFAKNGDAISWVSFEIQSGKPFLALGPGGSTNRDVNLYRDDSLILRTNSNFISDLDITARSFIQSGGISNEFLKADGSVDSNSYSLTGHTHTISDITDFPTDLSAFTNSVGYITGFTDTNIFVTGATVTGTTTKTINIYQSDGSLVQADFTDISGGGGGGDSITGATFDTSTGDLDLNSTGSTITVNLDGRYSITGHTHTVSEITDFPTNISSFINDVNYISGVTDTSKTLILTGDTITGITTQNLNVINSANTAEVGSIYVATDEINGTTEALYIKPHSGSKRLFFGTVDTTLFSLNLKNVGAIESMPITTFSNLSIGGTGQNTSHQIYRAGFDVRHGVSGGGSWQMLGDPSGAFTPTTVFVDISSQTGEAVFTSGLTANTISIDGGTSNDFLMADGSTISNLISTVEVSSSRNLLNTDIGNTLVCITGSSITITSGFTDMVVGQYINLEAHGTTLTISGATGVTINGTSGGSAAVGNNSAYVGGILRKSATNSYIVI